MKALHMVTADPQRTPTLTMFAHPDWFLFAAGVVFISLIVLRTDREEDRLVARFGDAYRTYMDRTGRFFPRVRAH